MEKIIYVNENFTILIDFELRRFVGYLVVEFVQLSEIVYDFVYFF